MPCSRVAFDLSGATISFRIFYSSTLFGCSIRTFYSYALFIDSIHLFYSPCSIRMFYSDAIEWQRARTFTTNPRAPSESAAQPPVDRQTMLSLVNNVDMPQIAALSLSKFNQSVSQWRRMPASGRSPNDISSH